MTAKHTPGPWFVSRDTRPGYEWNNHIGQLAKPHIEICAMFHTKGKDDNATGEANAKLVAAAPDLADALHDLICLIDVDKYPVAFDKAEYALVRAGVVPTRDGRVVADPFSLEPPAIDLKGAGKR
jgi:hypothetical protein